MNLAAYLDLYSLLQSDRWTRKEKRAFGIAHQRLKERPLKLLLLWVGQNHSRLAKPLLSEMVTGYLHGITLVLGVILFLLGLFSGMALLRYNGHEPVNVVYFMAMVILLPLTTMVMALFAMLRAGKSRSFLVHLSPAYWMEKMLWLLPGQMQNRLDELPVSPSLLNWLVIQRSQLLALLFSLGLLVSLLGMVATQDIAFAWSTTLHISAQEFHALLEMLALPWKPFFPAAVPSLELIEKSHYFRLGETLNPEMVHNASCLGEWWKFLACSTLFYAVMLRVCMWVVSLAGYRRALKNALLKLEGAEALLQAMCQPLITTSSPKAERIFEPEGNHYTREVDSLERSYDLILGWAIPRSDLLLLNDAMQVVSTTLEAAGGANSLEDDREIILNSRGEILLYVKAWEPPTMDFVDFLEALAEAADKITVVPVGVAENGFFPKANELAVWGRKLQGMEEENIWLKR